MAYKFSILPDASKQLEALDRQTARRILVKLKWLAEQDEPLRHAVFLHNSTIGDIRFRIGDYRAIAIIDQKKKQIAIAAIGHRREIYR